ncbi:cytosolic iron-sulfur assembly component 2B-like [Hydra vulgaris]|uniref:cytosolic iron-sulfur assembly component 2B-like n=1 Tax=Hydra vulgaris TaxID=6087 RepID=UPI0032EA1B05
MSGLQNANPEIYESVGDRTVTDEEKNEECDKLIEKSLTFLHLIRYINDPEHPLTLEQLNVVEEKNIQIDDTQNSLQVYFTPTIPHCSMATLIGLSIRVLLLRLVDVMISPGTHVSETAVNKQLADKERVAAALENIHLLNVINQCLKMC